MIVTEYEVGPGAYGVTLGADGAAWTSLTGRGELARVGPDGRVSHVSLDSAQSRPMVLARGPDDAIWFSRGDGQIGRADPAGTVSSMPVLTPEGSPYGLCAGPDATLWYTLLAADRVGRISRDGGTKEFALPAGSMPSLITAGPDGALWCTLNQADAIARIAADGGITTFALPTAGAAPVGIDAGAEAVWVAEIGAGQVARLFPDGRIEEFPLPDRSSRPHAVAATPDGGCWATLWAASSAVRLDQHGSITQEIGFEPGAEPHGIALGPGRSVWIALEAGTLIHLTESDLVNGRKRHIAVDAAGLLLAVVITAASVQDRDAARPLLWNLHRTTRRVRLIWADGVYAGKLAAWAAALKMNLQIVARRTPSRCCPAAGSWSGPSPGSASTAALPATTNAPPATKP